MSGPVSKISEGAYKVVMGTLPGIVLLAAVIRIAFQLKNRHRLFLSDFFLLLASTCLIAGTIVIYQFVDMLYLEQQLSENPLSVPITPDFLNAIPDSLKYLFSYQAILWAVVFSVKFSFLSFFRPLVSRLAKMITWWKCVTVTTAFAWAVCTVAPFIICPHFDFSSITCSSVQINHLAQPLSALVVIFDVVTDFMIISIPIGLLWNARMKPRQKIGILLSLCLSVSMIVVAIVRSSSLPRADTTQDIPYEIFLLQLEGCIAVLMASVSAFRSLFNSEGSRAARKKPKVSWTYPKVPWRRGKKPLGSESDLETNALPAIPSATMTGLRTFIRGGPRSTGLRSEFEELPEELPLRETGMGGMHTQN